MTKPPKLVIQELTKTHITIINPQTRPEFLGVFSNLSVCGKNKRPVPIANIITGKMAPLILRVRSSYSPLAFYQEKI